MSLCTLMAPPTKANLPMWSFDHAAAHRELTGGMSQPVVSIGGGPGLRPTVFGGLAQFSAIPYLLDPQTGEGVWHFNHDRAHQDATLTLPGWFGFTTGTVQPSDDFADMNFARAGMLPWWTFANHQFHATARGVLPLSLTYPF